MSKYLEFRLLARKPKTLVWAVYSRTQGSLLGRIAWFPRWRQYTFDPAPNTTFNSGCMKDICDFIQNEMDKRKKK